MSKDYDYLFKLLLIGSSNVGKSCLLLRFSDNIYNQGFGPTIGVDFKIRTIETGGHNVKLQLWDTSGIQRFKQVTADYYAGTHGIIIVYDITERRSFEEISNWLVEVDKYADENAVKLLVGNKSDLESERQVKMEEGKAFAESLGIKFLETSAKDSLNLEQIFTTLSNDIKSKMQGRIPKEINQENGSSPILKKTKESTQQQNTRVQEVDPVMKQRARQAMIKKDEKRIMNQQNLVYYILAVVIVSALIHFLWTKMSGVQGASEEF